MRKLIALAAALALTFGALAIIGRGPAKLPGSLLKPPVFAPSKLVGQPDAFPTPAGGSGVVYEIETKAPFDEVCAFYEKSMPGAKPHARNTATTKTWSWVPPGAAEGEDVGVTVQKAEGEGPTRISIAEVVMRPRP